MSHWPTHCTLQIYADFPTLIPGHLELCGVCGVCVSARVWRYVREGVCVSMCVCVGGWCGVWGCVCVGHKNTNISLILEVCDVFFISRARYLMGHFLGFFEGAKTFLTPKLVLA
jgi:hypothetical protein